LSPPWVLGLATGAVACFHLGFLHASLSGLALVWLGCLFLLRRTVCGRWAFYSGLAIGLGIYGPQLHFFWAIFGPAAGALWLVLAFWLALFLLLLHGVDRYWGTLWAVALAPVLWLGIEYFRSELYYLRFAWLTAGSFVPPAAWPGAFATLGVYGFGAVLMLGGAGVSRVIERCWGQALGLEAMPGDSERCPGSPPSRRCALLGFALLGLVVWLPARFAPKPEAASATDRTLNLAGVQLEFPKEAEVLSHLDRVLDELPRTELVLLGEYTFDGHPPDDIRAWCRRTGRWLVVGGKDPIPGGGFYNTAFVLSPAGEVVFQQAKSVPIQFFQDGTPAPRQAVWLWNRGETTDDPLRVGLAVCYDLSYARVLDRLVSQRPDFLLVPAMDAADWGRHQHKLNARMTLIRAAEYRLAIFRVATSGFSQFVGPAGNLLAEAGVPGQGDSIAAELRLQRRAQANLPVDRALAIPAVALTAAIALLLAWHQRRRQAGPRTKDYGLRTTDHGPRTTDHGPRITNHESRVTNHESRITSHESRVTACLPIRTPCPLTSAL
jgi:apolipoprotein N-acyltransferase